MAAAFARPALCLLLVLITAVLAGCSPVKTDVLASGSAEESRPAPQEASTVEVPGPSGSLPSAETGTAGTDAPDPDFYSLTMDASYEEYGIFTFLAFAVDNWYDGGKYYAIRTVAEGGDPSPYAPTTLKYRDYPDGESWQPVCSDPLCVHTAASGCPLAKCKDPFGFVCMSGTVFFVGQDDRLYLYSSADNSCTALHDRLYEYKLYEQDGALYAVYQVEDADFRIRYAALKATPDGTVTELGSVGELFAVKDSPVYADRYLLDAGFEGASACLYRRDLRADAVTTVLTLDYAGTEGLEPSSADVLAVYGDLALFRVIYRTDREHEDLWLADLQSGGARPLASKAGTVQTWMYSDRCVVWTDVRSDASQPFTVHLLFPKTGEEREYGLSDPAAAAGGTIPAGTGLREIKKGALLLDCAYGLEVGTDEDGRTIYEIKYYNVLEFDLQSGRLRLWPQPGLPEYESTFR